MTTTALVLILISAVAHAGWNFYGKKFSPTLAFFFIVTLGGSALFSPYLLWHLDLIGALSTEIIWLLVATGLFQSLYLWGLAAAYQSGDMSIAYPIARSSPLIIVCISAFILGQRDSISLQAIIGIVLIVGGCLLVPMRKFSDLSLDNYLNRSTAFAILAAFSTAGYSLVDDKATSLMRSLSSPGTEQVLTSAGDIALVYVILQGISASVWMALFVYFCPSDKQQVPKLVRNSLHHCLLTAVMMFGTYALVVASMAYVSNVSYVVAFRQISIPIGVMMGIVWLNEHLYMPKLVGVAITFSGLLAVALG
ncbi:EamA family transporter [Alkalimarinus coralli]|uniref:EamA family transporter n=1 Tax=Alkalimarinus coralli TaxID=2935863 RepID=UPI00202B6970|nr:EamA family transporter [Alkalimarinus coralli]